MRVYFNMFDVFVEHMIGRSLNSTRVVTIKRGKLSLGNTKFYKKAKQPHNIRTCSEHSTVFSLSKGLRDMVLFLTIPRNKSITQKDTPANSQSTRIRTTCPVSITISSEVKRCPPMEERTM